MASRFSIIALLLLLCACSSQKEVVRVDTLRVERVIERAVASSEHQSVHDTMSVLITRYDTLERVVERVEVQRWQDRVKWKHDTLTMRDTIVVAQGSKQESKQESVAVAEPATWEWARYLVAAAILLVPIVILWRKCRNFVSDGK